ncbi:MAG: isopeptide-forming domain-containing fimbrial protein, partial [Ruminococcus sp.]|nr:isopeptide-forming domain-containing fimbrial protein [Ruminococcus sp.]
STSKPSDFATVLSTLTETEAIEFAKVMGKYVSDTPAPATATENAIDVANSGYYLIKDTTTGDKVSKSLNLLKVAGTATINAKDSTVSSKKTVSDINDSTDAAATANQKSADYDIGDDIPYVLTFTLPDNYAAFDTYPLTFIDDMCAGLTYNGDAKIWYGEVTGEGADISFTADTSAESAYSGTVYKANIADLKTSQASFTSGTITIKYSARLNSDAVVGGAGNKNDYQVEFLNNPNKSGTGDKTPGDEDKSTTPKDTNVVFTYKLVVNKTDDNGDALTGADFTLSKWIPNESGSDTYNEAKGNWTTVSIKTGSTEGSVFTFNGLDDGIYKLSETTTPKGYNSIADKIFTISATHSDTGITDLSASGGLTIDGSEATGILSTDIANNKGIQLPGTGGMGTTVFYIVGSLMIAGALVLLVVRKRMNIKEK